MTAEELAEELDSLKMSFQCLHAIWKSEVISGNYVVAHEIVGQIHSLLQKYERRSTPPGGKGPSMRFFRGNAEVRLHAKLGMLSSHERYPGLVPRQILDQLPQNLSDLLLVCGESVENEEKVESWLKHVMPLQYDEAKTINT